MTTSNLSLMDKEAVIAEIKRLKDELEKYKKLYNELLFAVSRKFPDETRHETALRYIREVEEYNFGPAKIARECGLEVE